jgi:hypothetical protein
MKKPNPYFFITFLILFGFVSPAHAAKTSPASCRSALESKVTNPKEFALLAKSYAAYLKQSSAGQDDLVQNYAIRLLRSITEKSTATFGLVDVSGDGVSGDLIFFPRRESLVGIHILISASLGPSQSQLTPSEKKQIALYQEKLDAVFAKIYRPNLVLRALNDLEVVLLVSSAPAQELEKLKELKYFVQNTVLKQRRPSLKNAMLAFEKVMGLAGDYFARYPEIDAKSLASAFEAADDRENFEYTKKLYGKTMGAELTDEMVREFMEDASLASRASTHRTENARFIGDIQEQALSGKLGTKMMIKFANVLYAFSSNYQDDQLRD